MKFCTISDNNSLRALALPSSGLTKASLKSIFRQKKSGGAAAPRTPRLKRKPCLKRKSTPHAYRVAANATDFTTTGLVQAVAFKLGLLAGRQPACHAAVQLCMSREPGITTPRPHVAGLHDQFTMLAPLPPHPALPRTFPVVMPSIYLHVFFSLESLCGGDLARCSRAAFSCIRICMITAYRYEQGRTQLFGMEHDAGSNALNALTCV